MKIIEKRPEYVLAGFYSANAKKSIYLAHDFKSNPATLKFAYFSVMADKFIHL